MTSTGHKEKNHVSAGAENPTPFHDNNSHQSKNKGELCQLEKEHP